MKIVQTNNKLTDLIIINQGTSQLLLKVKQPNVRKLWCPRPRIHARACSMYSDGPLFFLLQISFQKLVLLSCI